MADPRPPGHTCPRIDRALHQARRLWWRARTSPDARDILRELVADLEAVREENRAMRAAYYDMRERLEAMGRRSA